MTSFQQIQDSTLYQVPPQNAGPWCGYMLGPGDTNPDAAISPADALNAHGGTFLFAPTAPQFSSTADANAFVTAVQAWLTKSGGQFFGRFCVWLPSAQPLVFGIGNFWLTGGTSYAVNFSQQTAGWALDQTFNALIGKNASLAVSAGTFLIVKDDSLAILAPSSPGVFFNIPGGMAPIVSPGGAALPLSGALAGCFVVSGSMAAATTLAGQNAGMLFAYGDGSGAGAGDVVQTYPLVNAKAAGATTPFAMVAAVDPLDPFCTGPASDPDAGVYRTILAAQQSGAVTIASQMRTATNQQVGLVPMGGGNAASGPAAHAGGFVCQPMTPLARGANGLPVMTDIYLTPAGDFTLSVAGTSAVCDLLCGLSGTETMQFRPAAAAMPDILRFTPCQPAYTPEFPFPQATLDNPSTGVVRTPLPATPVTYITAWAMLVAGGGGTPTYNAQPQGSNLYGPSGANGDSGILGAMLSTVPLTWRPGFAVPLVPWAGMQGGSAMPAAAWAPFESQVLSATRRNAILAAVQQSVRSLKMGRRKPRLAALHTVAVGPGAVQPNGTTPQGLLAQTETVSGITDYDAVVLSQSDTSGGPASQMAFFNLTTELQGLFQTNQLFAVVTDPTFLGTQLNGKAPAGPTTEPMFANSVNIAGWTMQASVGSSSGSTDVSNVMILKFCTGTVQDLVAKTSAWVDTKDFSSPDSTGGVCPLSQALQTYIAAAIASAAAGNTLYAQFASIVTDPDWQGILVLGAEVSPSDLPPQLAGLSAGIDFSRFVAHHFGVTVSPVSASGGVLSIPGTSSYFGLVDYMLAAYAANVAAGASPTQPLALPGIGTYGFTVLQLQALFKNSAMADFRSHVQVTANQMFGSAVTATYGDSGIQAANAVVLTGTYQSQGGTGTYLFESDSDTVFVTDSNMLSSVVLTKVMFNTLTADDGGTPPSILSRILMWGDFNFACLPDSAGGAFDILSYGMPMGTAAASADGGLAFSNLQLGLSSPVASPNMVTYVITEANIAFDQAASQVRPSSLAPGLVLQPESFVVTDGSKTPGNLGFLTVMLGGSGPPQTLLSGPWYGVSYLVNMGGPGALASAAGFSSHLLVAWSPQTKTSDTSYSVFVGLQLPGAAPGASCFSVQGVLNLTVQAISLSLDPVAGGGAKAFTLKLGNIGLKVLGVAKLPPSATIDMYLFGDPKADGSLGWYAAYVEDQGKQSASPLLPEARP